MKVSFVDLSKQDHAIRQQLQQAVLGVLERADYILGGDVDELEREFAAYCGAKYAVGVDNGLSALQLILRAYDIGPGDEVIVPTHTYVASATAISLVGATPVLVDTDMRTYNLDINQVESLITPKTRAIMAVHLYGLPADMDEVRALASAHGLRVIEDAAQAHGATYKGTRTGNLGDAAGFSFYPAKNLGAAGDAGIVVTNDPEVDARVRAFRNCGQYVKGRHDLTPYNHRLDTLQAAVLRVRLQQLDQWNLARQRIAQVYSELLAGAPVELPPPTYEDRTHVWHLYVIRTSDRDGLKAHLSQKQIGIGIHYPLPVHLQPTFAELGYAPGSFPAAEQISPQILSLPMHPSLTDDEAAFVAESIRAYFR
jgi:dTDP-4-amino-4,6-dideoxygalactose transaminase